MDLTCECGKPFSRKDSLKRHRESGICPAHAVVCGEGQGAKKRKTDTVILSERSDDDLTKIVSSLHCCTYVK